MKFTSSEMKLMECMLFIYTSYIYTHAGQQEVSRLVLYVLWAGPHT